MAINKVIYGGETLIDLTGDTVTANKIRGEPIISTYVNQIIKQANKDE